MIVTVLGVGEASDPIRGNSAIVVSAGGYRLLIDCGHSVPPALWRRFPDPQSIDAVYFTHHHPDHCFGLVPWLISLADDGRKNPLEIFSSAWGISHFKRLCEVGMVPSDHSGPFPIHWHEIPGPERIGPFDVRFARTQHSVVCHAIQLRCDGAVFSYSGDGRPTEESRALYEDAGLVLHECYMIENSDMPHHSDLNEVRALRCRGRIGIYHIRKDQVSLAEEVLVGSKQIFVVLEGHEIQLPLAS